MRLLCFKKNTLPGGKVRLTACPPPFSPTFPALFPIFPPDITARHPGRWRKKAPGIPFLNIFYLYVENRFCAQAIARPPKGEKGRFFPEAAARAGKKRASPVPGAPLRSLRCVRKRKAPFFRLPEHPFPVLPEAAQKRPVFSAGSAPGTALPGALFPKNKRLLPLCGRACLPESPKSTFR